ncbi:MULTISPECIES: ankyrin repeat domain-containing protein [Ehrlichia]|uniref:Ankyrin repeat family protein n=1 Tax=Ehrlichia cf. muris str. EmCRT TaxID=1359167 RepID=A0A0F3ND13_9RICK|nr:MULTISPECIES: ankyrin repeat domain-containing protein [Ehrlichia]KJV65983.1 ankyrin repeat family protein [Ehrlichia cf. muris str. EmCRT]OUC04875.1 hypothetical protein DB91_01185 [Ehrlichia sp. Wisconsin_h]
MTDPKKDDLQQNQKNPNVQGNNPPQDSDQVNPSGQQDQQLTEGQEQQLDVQEEPGGATGHVASPVLEEPLSIKEEETPPPLPVREGMGDVGRELESDIYQSIPAQESEYGDIYTDIGAGQKGDGQVKQQTEAVEDIYQGIPAQESEYEDIYTDIGAGQKDDGQVKQQTEAVEDIYASPLPKSQRPVAPPVLEEPLSIKEEETPPPLPVREGMGDVGRELESDIYQSIPAQESEYGDIYTDIGAGQKDDGQVKQQTEAVEDIYASPLPKSQRPVAPPVLEEPLSIEEEEIPPSLPPREDIGDVEGFIVTRYNGPSIRSRDLVDAPYHDSDGIDAMEFEDNSNWESVRNAVIRDERINPELLVTSGLMRDICDQIIQSKGNLSEQEIRDIVIALDINDQGVAEDIVNPIEVDVEGNPVSEARNVMTLLHLAYACNVDTRIISAIESTEDSAGYCGRDAYNIQDTEGNLPLHLAARNCTGQMLSLCISNTRSDVINLRNFGNETFLHIMCQNPTCSVENVQIAKECNADFAAVDGIGRLPLHNSAACSKPGVLASVLRNTQSCFSPETTIVNMQDQYGYTPLHCAVIGNNAEVLPLILLQNGINACIRDVNGYMPIHHAVAESDINTVKALCSAKASVKGTGSVAESLLSNDLHGNTPLHIACSKSSVEVFNALKKSIQKHHGADVFRESLLQGKDGRGLDLSDFTVEKGALDRFGPLFNRIQSGGFILSPVHCAIRYSNLQVLKAIFKYSPDLVQQESSTGVNSCHMAMLFGNAKTAKFIVNSASKAEVNAQSDGVPSPLHLACIRGNNGVIRMLVSHKDLEINQRMGPDQDTVLHYAISKGQHSLVKEILANPNIDVNVQNAAGITALHEALELGDLKVVKALCVAGADASIVDNNGKSAMSHAIYSGQREERVINTVKLLLDHGATLGSSEDKNVLLEKCAYFGYNKLLSMILNHKGVPTSPNSSNYPLSAAVICNNMAAVALLLRHGGDVNQKVPNPNSMHFGKGLLMVAVENSNLDMLKLLVQKKCDASVAGNDRKTVCHMLATHQDVTFAEKALKVIISKSDKGARSVLSKQDNLGNTPIHLAMQSNNLKMAADMMHAMSKKDLSKIIGTQNSEGNTLLHMAIKSGDVQLVKLVINSLDKRQLAALACVQNENGNTPLHLAMQNGSHEFAALILKDCKKEDLSSVLTPKDAAGNTLLHLVCKATDKNPSLDYIMKLVTDKLNKKVLKQLVNERNTERNTPVHYALSEDNAYASRLFPLCNTNTLTIPGADGKLLSECISETSIFRKGRGLFKLKPSLFKAISKSEAAARMKLSVASDELLSSVDDSSVKEKESSSIEILTDTTSSESLTEDQSTYKRYEENLYEDMDSEIENAAYGFSMLKLSDFQGSPVSSLSSFSRRSSLDVKSSSEESSVSSASSSFSTFGKGPSSYVESSDQSEIPVSQMQALSGEIENIVGDISEDIGSVGNVDIQSAVSSGPSQSTTTKKSSCHGK